MIEGNGADFDPWVDGRAAMADARVRLSAAASAKRAELEKGAKLVTGTAVVNGDAAGVGMTSGGRLVGTSEGNRATSAWRGSGAPGGAERGEDAFALLAFGAASGVSSAGMLRRCSGSGASAGLTGSGARASVRAGAPCVAESSAGALFDGAEMLMLGRATTAAELCAEALGAELLCTEPLGMGAFAEELLATGLLATGLLATGGGALTLALEPNEKPGGAARGADGARSAGGGRLDENAAGSGGAIEPCGGVESNRSLRTS